MNLSNSLILGAAGAFSLISCSKNNDPNIVLILADDMGFSDLGCYGSEINTPNIDKLASQGIRYSQFYNASRSCPSRASLLTGLYPHSAGVGDMERSHGFEAYQGKLKKSAVTIAEVLKSAKYNTYMSGKWHVGNNKENWPTKRGFDRYFGLISGASSYFDNYPYREGSDSLLFLLDEKPFKIPEKDFYLTDAITDHALEFIKDESKNKNPFFLYLAYTAPHWPLHALPEDIEKYRGKYIVGWDSIRTKRLENLINLGLLSKNTKLSDRDPEIPSWESLSEEEKILWDSKMAVYAAMIDRMDQGIGKIINLLEKTKEYDNTLIIFLSDNGGCHEEVGNWKSNIRNNGTIGTRESFDSYCKNWANVSNTPFRMYKHWVHEGGISTPFIARYPKMINQGIIDHEVWHINDVMATIVDITSAEYPKTYNGTDIIPYQGISLKPSFTGNIYEYKKVRYWEHEGNSAARKGDWKIVKKYNPSNPENSKWELYNIRTDRAESNNLIEEKPGIYEELYQWYSDWEKRSGVLPKTLLDSVKNDLKAKNQWY